MKVFTLQVFCPKLNHLMVSVGFLEAWNLNRKELEIVYQFIGRVYSSMSFIHFRWKLQENVIDSNIRKHVKVILNVDIILKCRKIDENWQKIMHGFECFIEQNFIFNTSFHLTEYTTKLLLSNMIYISENRMLQLRLYQHEREKKKKKQDKLTQHTGWNNSIRIRS